VLGRMLDVGAISQGEMFQAQREAASVINQSDFYSPDYYLDWAYREALQLIEEQGLQKDYVVEVKSTIDPRMQKSAQRIVNEMLDTEAVRYRATQAALVTMEPDGALKAIVGGRDYENSQFNRATDALRQPGSAFKPFVYLAALRNGFNPNTIVRDAPITIVEYASMTCGHCARFHNDVFPELKEKYIDTGKVQYVLREFPLDGLAVAAFMLARCAGDDRYYPMVGGMFETQKTWAVPGEDGKQKLSRIAKQAGFSQESFDKCLADQELFDKIVEVRKRGNEEYGVDSTPSFFVNGKRMKGIEIKDFDAAIEGSGGEIVVPKTGFGEAGWLAHVRDTEGNLIGLWQARSQ